LGEEDIPMTQVLRGVPIGPALTWWVERQTGLMLAVPAMLVQTAGGNLLAATSSLTEAHRVLSTATSTLAASRDDVFTEAAIRNERLSALAQRHPRSRS
jgi:HAMP domain-containing protein